jgi:hypothetical protein
MNIHGILGINICCVDSEVRIFLSEVYSYGIYKEFRFENIALWIQVNEH